MENQGIYKTSQGWWVYCFYCIRNAFLKTEGYDIIGINVFLSKLRKSLRKNG